ncbi:MAG: SusC/RagA family TonB-linked outer membrane protein, partial [Maribacter sp.]|nr:SusC/RagA family TonB-linked outer membrane protein [Maribacter sp.]
MKSQIGHFFALFLIFGHSIIAQEFVISGNVTDQYGIPLQLVNIIIKDTDRGAQTDFDGNYSIEANEADILVFSYLGLKTVEITVGSTSNINVTMEEDRILLDAIDLTALGIQRQRKTLTYQADKVNSENLNRVVPVRPALGLVGKVAGLQINVQDQGVNPNTQIILRGLRSISQSNSPIIVIDGSVASQGGFDALNPLDIESINVLKGGTAGILYGSLGSNGALIVTTKKGKLDQKFTIGLQSSISFENVAYISEFQDEYGMGFNGVDYNPIENTNWGPRFDGVVRQIGPTFADGSFQAVPYAAVKDNLKDFFETGTTLQNTLYLSGGNQGSSFYLSLSDQETRGLIPSDSYDRNTFRVNASKKLGDLTLSLNSSYFRDRTSVVGSRLGPYELPIWELLLYTAVNIPLTNYKDWQDPNSFGYADNYYNGFVNNPYWAIGTHRDNDETDRLIANLQASWDITDWLNLTTRLGLNNTNGSGKDYRRRQSYDPVLQPYKAYVSPFLVESEFQSKAISLETILKADFDVNEIFDVTAILGATNNFFESRSSSIGFNDLNIPGFFDISNGLGTPVLSLDESEKRVYGFFADATLGYNDLLYLNLAGRYDFTSTLPSNENNYFYPAVGLSYILSESLASLKENNHYIKLAISNSTTYNDLGPYEINERYSQAASFPYGNLSGFEVSDVAVDPGISKEKINTTEIGLNSKFMNNRLSFDAAYFFTKSTDLITLTTPSVASGANAYLTNIGEVQSKGVELTLGSEILRSKNWGWDASLNFTSYESVVNEIAEGVNEVTISSLDRTGGSVG